MEIVKCEECIWSNPIKQNEAHGRVEIVGYECRHRSPSENGWPMVRVFDWCGEGRFDE